MKYAFIDPANKSGVCIVENGKISTVYGLRKIGTKGAWTNGKEKFHNDFHAWCSVVSGCDVVVCEEGFGRFSTAIKSQSGHRSYIRCICDYYTNALGEKVEFKVVNVSEWRRVIKEAYGVSFPAESARCKELSKKLVREHFGLDVTDDESDAVLLFAACKRMGMVEV